MTSAACPNSLETLPDYLKPGLDIVLIGLNPSTRSVQAGHYFANPRNRFWPAVSASGLVGREVGPEYDAAMLEWGIGFTDLVKASHAPGLGTYRGRLPAGRTATQGKDSEGRAPDRMFPRPHRLPRLSAVRRGHPQGRNHRPRTTGAQHRREPCFRAAQPQPGQRALLFGRPDRVVP